MKVNAQQNDTVDAVCWRHYGRTQGTVEAVLEANPGLAELGAVLPIGTAIELPEIETIESVAPLIQLFD
jgi:phage tail protein X